MIVGTRVMKTEDMYETENERVEKSMSNTKFLRVPREHSERQRIGPCKGPDTGLG